MANLSSVPECLRALQRTVRARERALPPFFGSRYCKREAAVRKFVDAFLIKRHVKRAARQTTLKVASSHAKAGWAISVLQSIARFLHGLVQSAEQLTADQRWRCVVVQAAARGTPVTRTAASQGARPGFAT